MIFQNVTFIGIGLIASSMALRMRRDKLCEYITAIDLQNVCNEALELKLVDQATTDLAEGVKNADLIVLATPVQAMGEIAQTIALHLKPDSIVTDVGSVKQYVVEEVGKHIPFNFVPAHPIAGTEYSGPSAGFPGLFDDNWCIVTPINCSLNPEPVILSEAEGSAPSTCALYPDTNHPGSRADPSAIAQDNYGKYGEKEQRIIRLWQALGSKVDIMDAKHHDEVLAITSHLPHYIAYNIVGTVTDLEEGFKKEIFKYSASGFRDFTRIAASDPIMWRDIALTNKDAILEMLGRFSEDLSSLQKAIRWGDGEALEQLFTRTRDVRKNLVKMGVVKNHEN